MPYKFKRALSSAAVAEAKQHTESGECQQRVIAFRKRESEERKSSTLTKYDVENMFNIWKADVYREFQYIRESVEVIRARVERRLESRRTYKDRNTRAALPKPWDLDCPIKALKEAGVPVAEKFKEILLKPVEHWCWQVALGNWFDFLLESCSVDAVMVRRHDDIHYYEFGVPKSMSRLQFFPCWKKVRAGPWDRTAVEGGFFGAFLLVHLHQLRRMFHWENRILFELRHTLKAKEAEIRAFERVMPECPYEADTSHALDIAIADVFYRVLCQRRKNRKLNRTDEEVYEADLEEKFSEK